MTAIGSRTSEAGSRLSSLVDDDALLAAMLRYEAALARASADCGLAPRAAADAIGRVCERLADDRQAARQSFDSLTRSGPAPGGDVPGAAFVRRLAELVAAEDTNAARFVHFGSSNADLLDSATMLMSRAAARELDAMLAELGDALAALADRHRDTLLAPVDPSQAAAPLSFGWKAARWLDQIARSRRLLERTVDEQAALQFGGVDGALAEVGEAAPQLTRALADELWLPVASISWHGARDRFARIGAELAMVCGAAVRIGHELPQPVRAGSDATSALAAAREAPGLAGALLTDLAPGRPPETGHVDPRQDPARVLRELFEAAGTAVDAILAGLDGLQIEDLPTQASTPDRTAKAQLLIGATAMLDAVLDDWHAQRSETTA